MKLRVILQISSIMFLVFVSSLYSQEMSADAKKLLLAGDSLTKAENYADAIKSYDQALAISKDYRIYFQKSLAQKKLRTLMAH